MTLIPDPVLAVLDSGVAINGNHLTITAQLDRKLYVAVNKVLEALGGKWNRSAQAHVFADDPTDVIDAAILTGAYTDERKQFDVFLTPPAVADLVVDLADIRIGMKVLEPSAGEGALATRAAAAGAEVVTYELRDITGVPPTDFLTVSPAAIYDRVVMNPPFSRQQDMVHVTHAWEFVKPGGRLVAIMSPAFQFRQSSKAAAFRSLLDSVDHEITPLPDGSFRESGTNVSTVIVTMDKELS